MSTKMARLPDTTATCSRHYPPRAHHKSEAPHKPIIQNATPDGALRINGVQRLRSCPPSPTLTSTRQRVADMGGEAKHAWATTASVASDLSRRPCVHKEGANSNASQNLKTLATSRCRRGAAHRNSDAHVLGPRPTCYALARARGPAMLTMQRNTPILLRVAQGQRRGAFPMSGDKRQWKVRGPPCRGHAGNSGLGSVCAGAARTSTHQRRPNGGSARRRLPRHMSFLGQKNLRALCAVQGVNYAIPGATLCGSETDFCGVGDTAWTIFQALRRSSEV